jgi:hypothetical protein
MASAAERQTADGFTRTPTSTIPDLALIGKEPTGSVKRPLTAAQKKLLKREYKKADSRMKAGVGSAWGKHAVKALKAGTTNSRVSDVVELRDHDLAPVPAISVALSPPRAFALGAAFVTCFAIVFASRPDFRSLSIDSVEHPAVTIVSARNPEVQSAAATPDESVRAERIGTSSVTGLDSELGQVSSTQAAHAPILSAKVAGAPLGFGSGPQTIVPKLDETAVIAKTATFAGLWGADQSACSTQNRKGLLPTLIDADGARAGETFCRFKKIRQTDTGWNLVANCSNPHQRWTANVRLKVQGARLAWSSERGSQVYVRCEPGVVIAQASRV